MRLRIGTRGSRLALWQAHYVRDRLLAETDSAVTEVELVVMTTRGDKILDQTLSKVGGKGLFVKEIEQALIDEQVDIAVHSLKDLPAALPEGLTISAYPRRADFRDALVLPKAQASGGLATLAEGACVGTSSLRRAAQLLALRPDLRIVPIRGNVPTRLRKLDEGVAGMEATVLACAGLERLGLGDRISEALDPERFVPAVGQGALAIQTRSDDRLVSELVHRLDDQETRISVSAERQLLATLEGSCQVPLGAWARHVDGKLAMDAFVGRPDGALILRDRIVGECHQAVALGTRLAQRLLDSGAQAILTELLSGE